MSVDTQLRAGASARPAASPRRSGLERPDLALLVVFGLLSLWTCGLDVWQIVMHGQHWTGTDGIYIVDQMQYLSWIRSSSHHVLAANLFVLRATPADYFQPAVIISAALTRVGVPAYLALLLWKPIAVACAFFAFRVYVRSVLPGRTARTAALLLALFFGCFSVVYGDFGVVGDLMPVFQSWGYTFGLLAIGLMALSLLLHARARAAGTIPLLPGLVGALATTLHPWQGELIGVIVVASELVMWRAGAARRRHVQAALATLVPIVAALIYYWLLGQTDSSWEYARQASKHEFSLWTILLACAPLLVPAALAWRPRRLSYLAVVTRVWPLAAFLVWVLSASALSATPLHAFDGISLPLAVLAVEAVGRARLTRLPHPRLVSAALLFLLTVPATAHLMNSVRALVAPQAGNPAFITASESAALDYLGARQTGGGVMTRFYLGTVVPARTGRRTFVGDCLWSQPNCLDRAQSVERLFEGQLAPAQAQAFVRASGARFLLEDCATPGPRRGSLGGLVVSERRFGCAAVLELVPPGPPTGPLAESSPDAALRPPWRQ